MRVLQVVTYMGRGGLETMLMNYYRNIDREKVQFDFLVHRDFRADYDDEIEAMGGRIFRLPPLNPFSLNYLRQLNRFFEEHPEYKIVHVHQDCLSSIILKVAQKHGVAVRIAHSHSSRQTKNIRYLLKLYYKRMIPQYATKLIACSQEAGNWMFGSADFEVLNNAIDAEKYIYNECTCQTIRSEFGVKGDELLVGHVGNFSRPKNHEFLLDVFAQIEMKRKAKLLLVGGKNLKPDSISIFDDMKAKAKALNLEKQIIFAGTRDDVHKLLQAMDVFIFPSTFEGLPVTTIEAQAASLPCLISENVPIECKVTDLITQMELSSGVEQWSEVAIMMAEKNKRYNRLDEIVQSGFDVKENAGKLQEMYLKAAAGERELCLS